MNVSDPARRPWWRDGLVLGLLGLAILFSLVYGFVHVAGLRPYTSILSGSLPPGASSYEEATLLGAAYAASYFGFVLGTPICLLAALVYSVLQRFLITASADPSRRQGTF